MRVLYNLLLIDLLWITRMVTCHLKYMIFVILQINFSPQDFSDQEKIHLWYQLKKYERDVPHHPGLKKMKTIVDLCRGLVKIENQISTLLFID